MHRLLQNLKIHLEYAGFRTVAAIVRLLPVGVASNASAWVWRQVAPFTPRHKRALAAIGGAFPDKDQAWRRARIHEMWDNLGRVFAESFHLERIIAEDRVVYDYDPEIPALVGETPRFVATAPHLGNWETGATVGPELGAAVCGIYQRVHNPLINEYIHSLRLPLYQAGLFAKRADAGRKVIGAMRAGASLVTMGDLRDWGGPSVPFFGKPAPSNTFPALMARMFNAPLLAGVVVRAPEGNDKVRFRVTVVPIPVPRTSDRDADVLAATAALQQQFEAFVREHPGQWMWAHRRWG